MMEGSLAGTEGSLAGDGSVREGGKTLEVPGTFGANLSHGEGQRGHSQGRNWAPWAEQGPPRAAELLPPGVNPGC